VSDDKDDLEASDWLSSQFAATEQVPKQPAGQPVAPPQTAAPVFGTSPAQIVPTPSAPPPATAPAGPPLAGHAAPPPLAPTTPAAATPSAPPPAQNSAGGFNWGLRPGGAADADSPSVAPPQAAAPPPLVPPPLVQPPLVQPPASEPTTPYVPPAPEPTQPLSWGEFAATQNPPTPPPAADGQPTQAYTVQPWDSTPSASLPAAAVAHDDYHDQHHEPTSAIDSLFGDHQFQDYEEVGVLKTVQTPPITGSRASAREPRAPLATSQKALMGVAVGLIGVLMLIGLFFIGEHLGAASAATPSSSTTPGSTTTPTPAGSGGPASPGVQQWSALQGGECIQPFSSAWAVTFTVVTCSDNHDAQMVFKGKLSDADNTGYPTTSQLQTELTALCSAPTAINYTAAASVTDLQVSFSYPPSASRWIAGDRTYYCFVDRASGGALPGDLSVPGGSN
jgi:hypothetical protein